MILTTTDLEDIDAFLTALTDASRDNGIFIDAPMEIRGEQWPSAITVRFDNGSYVVDVA